MMMNMMMTRTCEVVAGDLLPTRAPSAPQPNLTQPLDHHDHNYSGIDDDDINGFSFEEIVKHTNLILFTWQRYSTTTNWRIRKDDDKDYACIDDDNDDEEEEDGD